MSSTTTTTTGSFTASDGTPIAYTSSQEVGEEGAEEVVLLVHGYAASAGINWVMPGVFAALAGDETVGKKVVVAVDMRGHGASGKSGDPEVYAGMRMAMDCAELLAHLGGEKDMVVDVVGYSMGAKVSLGLAVNLPTLMPEGSVAVKLRSLTLSGHGVGMTTPWEGGPPFAHALENGLREGLSAFDSAMFDFVAQAGCDVPSMAAVARSTRFVTPEQVSESLALPTLLLSGTEDASVEPLEDFAALVSNQDLVTIVRVPGSHATAPAHPDYASSLISFINNLA